MGEHLSPREALHARIRPLCGFGPQGEQTARAIVELFTLVEYRDHDVDVSSFGDARRQLLRHRWIACAVADGPARMVQAEWPDLLPFEPARERGGSHG